MKAKIVSPTGTSLDIYYISALPCGYGHKEITVELALYDGQKTHYKEFKARTNNMTAYDDATDIERKEDRDIALYNIVSSSLEDRLIEWEMELDEE